jgi:hypothetical protein
MNALRVCGAVKRKACAILPPPPARGSPGRRDGRPAASAEVHVFGARIALHIEHRARSGGPACPGKVRCKSSYSLPPVQSSASTCRSPPAWTAFDRGVGRSRGDRSRLRTEGDGYLLASRQRRRRDAVGRPVWTVPKSGCGLGGAYGSDVRVRVGIHRQRVDRGFQILSMGNSGQMISVTEPAAGSAKAIIAPDIYPAWEKPFDKSREQSAIMPSS